ncbi:uncharacterized protein LOC128235254 isoform X2 [Mya arenaria]|uniref:uncharacterized protein LOC128235254 isoform X2 n=1 Tax=Mya arenaria TaxID=6604 RepID=UPI0022DEC898|nr:uncharacterized protein LOC128235254 isoform X2 [Mya arenaria]
MRNIYILHQSVKMSKYMDIAAILLFLLHFHLGTEATITLHANGSSDEVASVPVNSALTLTCTVPASATSANYYRTHNGTDELLVLQIAPSSADKCMEHPTYKIPINMSCSCMDVPVYSCTVRSVSSAMNGDTWKCAYGSVQERSNGVQVQVQALAGIPQSVISPSGVVPVARGSNLTLTCSNAAAEFSLQCQWFSNIEAGYYSLKVLIQTESCLKLFGNETLYGFECLGNNVFKLIIYNVQNGSDGSHWRCNQLFGNTVTDSEFIQLDVKEKPSISGPRNVSVGDNVTVSCHSVSTTLPSNHEVSLKYIWYINGQKNPNETRYVFSLTKDELVIVGIRKEDVDLTFQCYATEKNTDGFETPWSLIYRFNVIYGPQIAKISVPSEFTIIEGQQSINIECKSDCWPDCNFNWMNSSSNTFIAANCTLTFLTVTRYFTGKYKCVSTNIATGHQRESTINILVQYAPDVEVIANNVTTKDNQAQLRCSAHGNPDVFTYKWQQKWPDSILTKNWTLSGSSVLNLTDLSYDNSGIYTCFASNGIPHFPDMDIYRSSSTYMFVKDVPVVVHPLKPNEGRYVIFANLKETVDLNITVFSNNGLISTNISTTHDQSKNMSSIRTIDKIIQLPVFGSTVPAKGWLIFITFFLGDTSDFTTYDVMFTNEIGAVTFAVKIKHKETSESKNGPLIGGVTASLVVIVVLFAIIVVARRKYSTSCLRKITSKNMREGSSTTRNDASPLETNNAYEQIEKPTELPEYTKLKKDHIGETNAYDDLTPTEPKAEYENTVTVSQTGLQLFNVICIIKRLAYCMWHTQTN